MAEDDDVDAGQSAGADSPTALVYRSYNRYGKPIEEANEALTEDDDRALKIRKFITTPAKVSLNVGGTFPTEIQYEQVKVSINITLPCYKEEIDETYDFAKRWALTRLHKELERLGIKPSEEQERKEPKRSAAPTKKTDRDDEPKKKSKNRDY